MSERPKIAVLGSLIYDCVVYARTLPRKGETIIGHDNGFNFGGKGGNQAVQAARLGADVSFIGRVGNDETGEKLVRALQSEGINTDYITVDDETPSGVCCIFVDDNGDNMIVVVPHANMKVTKADIDAALPVIRDCDVFLTQFENSMEAIAYAVKKAHGEQKKVVVNPAPACDVPDSLFAGVDFLIPNETEAEFFSGVLPVASDAATCKATAKALIDAGAGNVIITLGADGAYYANAQTQFVTPPLKIDAVDATAAGDAFNAGFVVKLAQGASVQEAIRYGNAAGAAAASKAGAQPSLSKKDELDAFIAAHSNG